MGLNFWGIPLTDLFETTVVDLEKVQSHNPVIVGGFVGPTLTGFISASYIIERLKMHQIAHVKSPHIPPVSVFIGKKLRTPFRIYSNKEGTLIVAICEVPIDDEGLYEISSVLLKWFMDKNPRDMVILEGSPVPEIVREHKVYCIANEDKLRQFTQKGMEAAHSALITGMGGALLNESMAYKLPASTFITPASMNIADPGSVLALIENVNDTFGLKIDTAILEESVKDFHTQLQELVNQYKKAYSKSEKPPSESMYG